MPAHSMLGCAVPSGSISSGVGSFGQNALVHTVSSPEVIVTARSAAVAVIRHGIGKLLVTWAPIVNPPPLRAVASAASASESAGQVGVSMPSCAA